MADDTYGLIKQAILNKDQVVAVYGGRPRMLCPHVLGSKNGVPHGIFYQFGGTSEHPLGEPGSPLNWRCMLIAGLSQVQIVKGRWFSADTAAEHHQYCMDKVDVVAAYFRWPLSEAA